MESLRTLLGADIVSTSWTDRLALAHDASLYRMVPVAVVRPTTRSHIQDLLAWCTHHRQHLAFRAAGTSLSGQAVTDGILVDLSRGWKGIAISDHGRIVSVDPGITGAMVNARLRPFGRRLGPDPASLTACMVGGIVANNASGMCCGTHQNSYHTIESVRIVLADGTVVDTALEDADARLERASPAIASGLATLRDAVRADTRLCGLIRRKYLIKNTIGYSLNAFLDEDTPARILMRLIVGSEGTLGFIDNVTFRTVPDALYKRTALFIYHTLDAACAQVEVFREAGAAAVELMDDASLQSFAALPTTPERYRITADGAAALLVEFQSDVPFDAAFEMPGDWTDDVREQQILWHLRKGLMPTVGAARPPGSTMINEDVAVPPHHLAALVRRVRELFKLFKYEQGIIFGHAKDGNIHFVVHQRFDGAQEIERYARFMDAIAQLVIQEFGGSLKAEHGTGRNMAPYVEYEWGKAATRVMRSVKNLLDPHGILNPGVVINDDSSIHLKNIKPVPVVHPVVDACIECGFCEHACPSRHHTLTPRQRIVLRREQAMATPDIAAIIGAEYDYQGIETCAGDSLCSVVCPVGIDTGVMIRQMRAEQHGGMATAIAGVAARNYGMVNAVARTGIRAMHMFNRGMGHLGRPDHDVQATDTGARFVVMPGCPSRWAGARSQATGQYAGGFGMLVDLCHRAGIHVDVLERHRQHCCGQPFESKGYPAAALEMRESLGKAVDGRTLVLDVGTCAASIVKAAEPRIDSMDIVTFLHDVVMPSLSVTRRYARAVVHPGCSTAALGNVSYLVALARTVATEAIVPAYAGCCAMAGDLGIRDPALAASALAQEAEEILHMEADLWLGTNPLCEANLRKNTGKAFMGIVEALWQCS